MVKKVIIVCEGKSDYSYLNALQRFIENDLPLPEGQVDTPLRFVPCPDPYGTGTGNYEKIVQTYRDAVEDFAPDPVEIWVDADIYIRNEPYTFDPSKHNGDEYRNREQGIPIFHFSYHNFEDFVAFHCDKTTFEKWKANVLFAASGATNQAHHDWPLASSEYAPQFQKVVPHYSKRKMPFSISVDRLANLRRNLQDPDVKTMSALLQPGIEFGSRVLELFDAAYPGLIPRE